MVSFSIRQGLRAIAVGMGLGLMVTAVAGGCARRDPLTGGTASGGTGGTGGAVVTGPCAADQTQCGTACVYLTANDAHCGACDNACTTGTSCQTSTCACQAGLTGCPGGCVDTLVSATHCGTCGTACGIGQSCASGACSCGGGLMGCPSGCVDAALDEANCGACGTACALGSECLGGACSCQAGLTPCNAACVDAASDPLNCGGCGIACAGAQVCSNSVCSDTCAAGLVQCGASCVSTQNSIMHCGACNTACVAGQVCTAGTCGCSTAGESLCGGACANTQADPANCGTCGVTCGGGQSCVAGACTCPAGQAFCGGACVDVQTDAANCGTCANACGGGLSCQGGTCLCPTAGQTYCGGSCLDTQTDPANCGACGESCPSGTCEAGVCTGVTASCSDGTFSDKYSPGYAAARNPQVDTLIASMSTQQKARQMRGTASGSTTSKNWTDIQRSETDTDLNIRGYYFRDGPRGVNLEPWQQNRNGGEDYSTAFPVPIAQGAAFDVELVYRMGEAMGDETVASLNNMLLAPCMNLLRHPLWGRAQETFGEDTWHLGRIASAYTAGLQTYVAGCAKHYAGNNIEEDRFNENAVMDEQTLREVYGRHFEMVVREGGVACVMAAYNSVNGTKSTQNRHLLTEMLRQDMGFRGFVLSDWWAMPGNQDNGLSASTYQNNARGALDAGLDMELPWSMNYGQIESIVGTGAGQIPIAVINDAAGRILEQKFRFNTQNPSGAWGLRTPVTSLNSAGSIQGNQPHLDLAREAAVKSMVLLKNDGATLPIPNTVTSVAVLGGVAQYLVTSDGNTVQTVNFATDIRTGDRGSSRVKPNPAQSSSPLQGIQAAATRRGGVTVTSGTAASAAASADFVVVVVGLTAEDEGEEYTGASDRTTLALDGKRAGTQNQLVQQAAALGKPMAVVLVGGSVIDMPWLASVPAVIMSWYPGQRGGDALGALLFGEENFGGKLPITWGTLSQYPTFDSGSSTTMDFYAGYRRFDQNDLTPTFPFGHGLSYSSFTYANLEVPCATASKGAVVDVKVDVTNTGTVTGDEVVFLFVSFPQTSRSPVGPGPSKVSEKELRGFARAADLAPGETRRVTIPLRVADLKYWNLTTSAWEVESGPVEVRVGGSSANLPLTGTMVVE